MTDIRLTRSVPVTTIDVIAQLAAPDKSRKDILSILRLSADNDGVTPRLIADDRRGVIPSRDGIAERILHRLIVLGLLDTSGRLTPQGWKALEDSTVYMPERGRYTLYFVDDPLIPHHIVAAVPTREPEPSGHFRRKEPSAPTGTARETPTKLKGAVGSRFVSLPDGQSYELQHLESTAEQAPRPAMELRLDWTVRPNKTQSLRATGTLGSAKFERTLPTPAGVDHLELMFELAPTLRPAWSSTKNALLVDVPINPVELSSFRRKLHVPDVRTSRYGAFEPTVVDGIPLAPESPAVASRWALWHLDRAITTYCHGDAYAQACRSVQTLFPHDEITWPTQPERADAVSKSSARTRALYWYLRAPLDLPAAGVSQ